MMKSNKKENKYTIELLTGNEIDDTVLQLAQAIMESLKSSKLKAKIAVSKNGEYATKPSNKAKT